MANPTFWYWVMNGTVIGLVICLLVVVPIIAAQHFYRRKQDYLNIPEEVKQKAIENATNKKNNESGVDTSSKGQTRTELPTISNDVGSRVPSPSDLTPRQAPRKLRLVRRRTA